MNLKNKNFKIIDDIVNFKIDDPVTSKVGNFYETDPFPNYEINDNINKILQIGDQNFFLKSLKKNLKTQFFLMAMNSEKFLVTTLSILLKIEILMLKD